MNIVRKLIVKKIIINREMKIQTMKKDSVSRLFSEAA